MNRREELEARITNASKALDRAIEALEKLENLPTEPTWDGDENPCIMFRKQFAPHGVYYTYCAVQVNYKQNRGNGYYSSKLYNGRFWFVSGSKTLQGVPMEWDVLLEWIMSGTKWEIWLATGFEEVGRSGD